jgi:peptide/nickel transport system substrate-binding protein
MTLPGPIGPRRALAALAAVLTAGTLTIAPLAADASTAPSPGKKVTFTVGVTQDVDSLNPFIGVAADAYEIYQLNYDTLTDYSVKDFSATPAMASSWDTSADGLTWTFHLRAGLKWSDGVPLTARDVAYTFNRIRTGKFEQTNYGNYVAAMKTVTATDDRTVVFTLSKPTPVMLHLYVYILPEHIWKNVDEAGVKKFANNPTPGGTVGSGPFLVTQRSTRQFIRLKANPNFRGGKPHIDELVFRVFNSEDSLAQALRRGEIDFADNLGSNVFNSLKNATGVKTFPAKYSGFDEVAMNTGAALDNGTPIGDGHPALKDKRVRVAIAHAIDTQTIVKRVYGGFATPGTSVIPSIYQQLHYDPGSTAYSFDPAEANRLLDQAGYRKGSDGIRRMPGNGRPLRFRLFGRSNSQPSQQTVQFVAGWLKDIGLDVRTKIVSEDALTELIGQGNYDLFEWGWVVEPDPNYQLSTFTCANRSYKDGGSVFANLSDSFYCNKQYDALNNRQSQQVDVEGRTQTVKAMQKMLYDDAPYVITAYYDNLEAYRSDRFTGFQPQPSPNGSLLFQYGTHSYQSLRQVTKASGGKPAASSNSGLVVGGVVGGAAVLGGLVFFALRGRRRPESDVE